MKNFKSLISVLALLATTSVQAATKDEWRGRTIYQIVTDRFAQPTPEQALTDGLVVNCDPKGATWCGGNWRSVIDKLDYIKDMGFTAIWISPVNQNIDTSTPYGRAIHGYWVNDLTKLNPRFGTPNDLKSLVQAAHDKGIYVMVDVVINHIATTPGKATVQEMLDADPLMMYRDVDSYHNPYCRIRDWNKLPEYRVCSLGDDKVALVDVATENPSVQSSLNDWISGFVKEYAIDGLRLDAAKHIEPATLQKFQAAAGVFSMGEVFSSSSADIKAYVEGSIDSAHSYPLFDGLKKAFSSDSGNVQSLLDKLGEQQYFIKDTTVLGSFIGNHDNTRWYAANQDKLLGQNAIVSALMVEGIPTFYYGDEQELAYGMDDPDNRQALWSTIGGVGTTEYPTDKLAYQTIKRVNQVRGYLSTSSDFDTQVAKPVTPKGSKTEAAFEARQGRLCRHQRAGSTGGTLAVPKTGFNGTAIDMLTCTSFEVASDGSIEVSFADGGKPLVFLSAEDAAASGICPDIPGAASTTVAASSAVPTVSLVTSAADASKTVLPAGTTSAGEVIEAMPTSIRHGTSAIVDTTAAIAVPTDGPGNMTASDASAAQSTQVSSSDVEASSIVDPGASTDASSVVSPSGSSVAAAPAATGVEADGKSGTGNTVPQATGPTGIAPSRIDSQPNATAPTDAKDPMVTSIGSAQPSAVQVSFLWSMVLTIAYQGLLSL